MGRGLRKPVAIWATLAMLLAFLSLGTGPAIALPASPTITGLTSTGPKYVAVSFTAADNGGTALSTYIYSTDNGTTWKVRDDATAGTAPALASPLVITSRSSSNGKAALGNNPAQIMIRACWALPNNPGASDFNIKCSATSNLQSITPGTPSAPTITSIAPGNTSLSVAFTAPSSDGGSTITNYEYSTDNGLTWTARSPQSASSPLTISGLTNGTTYQVAIRAKNTTGVGTASSSLPGTPASTPSAPLSLIALPGNSSVNVSWSAPSSNGGSAITGYTVTSTPSSTGCTITDPTVRTCAATGLTNGTSYTFTVRAVNSVGAGTAATTGSVTAGVPGAPIIGSVTPGDGQLSVSFTAPSSNGSAISNYEYTLDAGASPVVWVTQNPTSIANPLVITGLTNLTSYNIAIRAVNSFGTGAISNSVSATPKATLSAPSAPTISSITPGNTILDVAFTVGSNGGATITNYEYTLDAGSNWVAFSPTTVTSPVRITGLTNGTLYTVQIRAVNSVGSGAASGSASGTPASVPGAPTSVSGVANGGSVGSGFVTVSWSAPSSTGGSPITGYKIEASSNAGSTYSTLIANTQLTATSQLVGGLTGGTSYLFRVSAINAIGSSNPSSASSAVLATTAPDAPVLTSVVSGSSQLTLNFTLGSNGGSAVKEIDYSTDNGATWYPIIGTSSGAVIQYPSSFDPSAANPATLANGTSYPVTLRAVTLVGTSASSNTINGTPLASASSDSALAGLTISSGTLSPTFAAGTFSYDVSVGAAVSSVTVTPTRNQSAQVITVNGTVVTSGVASGAIALNVGNTTITVIDTAQNGATSTYVITVFRPSNNANLASLTLSAGTLSPTFDAGTISYSATVAYSVSSISAVATTVNADSTITFNSGASTSGATSTLALNVGSSNTMAFRVLAQDGTTAKTYTVTITRLALSTDSKLSNLAISSGTLSPSFSSLTTNYLTTVSSSLSSISVTPTRNQLSQTITVNGATVASGVASDPISLSVGHNTITVVVTAEDTTTTTYTLDVLRPSNNAKLGSLTVSSGTLSPTFDGLTTSYSVTVGGSVSTIDVVSTLSSADATQTINTAAVSSGATKTISLAVGTTTITIVVTAQDGVTTKTYTISVTRPSSDSSLTSLSLSSGTLSPTFASNTTSYSATVANSVGSITVTPTGHQSAQVIKVNGTTVATGVTSGAISLSVGSSNTITVLVTAEDLSTTTYSITITRLSNLAALSALTVSTGTLSPTFDAATTSYSVTVSNSDTSIGIVPTVVAGATQTVNTATVASGATKTITLSVGVTTVTIVVTSQDTLVTRTYTISVTRPSNDSSLSALSTSTGTLSPTFSSGTHAYSISVSNATTSISLTATRNHASQGISVGSDTLTSGVLYGPVALQTGANLITVHVVAQDGSYTNYVLTVNRATSTVSTLSSLVPSVGSFGTTFASGTTAYSMLLSNSVSQIRFTPTLTDSAASVTVAGTSVTSGTASGLINLSVGDQTVDVVVTAESGATRTYQITITRKSADATLSSLAVTGSGTWDANFASGTHAYAISVANSVSSVTVTPTRSESHASITVNSTSVNSGSPSPAIALQPGATTTITVVVTAQDGNTISYVLSVTRDNIAPNAPTSVILSGSDTQLSVSWTAPTANTGSAVTGYTATASDGTNTFQCTTAVDANCVIIGLTNGVTYTVTVIATNSFGNSSPSASASGAPYQRPNVPDVSVTRFGNKSITVSWNAVGMGGGVFSSYLVERQVIGTTTSAWQTATRITDVNVRTYEDTNLDRAKRYNYRVTVETTSASSDNTAAAATVSNLVPRTTPADITPIKALGKLLVNLTWSAPSDTGDSAVTGYQIQYRVHGTSTWTDYYLAGPTEFSKQVTGLTKGTQYDFQIVVINDIGSSTSPNVVTETAVTVPGSLSSPGHSAKDLAVELTWSAPSDNGGQAITGYLVESSTDGSTWSTIATLASTATSYLAATPTKGATYNFRVSAINGIGSTETPTTLSSFVAVTHPGNGAAASTSKRDLSFDLTWVAATDDGGSTLTGYVIQQSIDGTNWTQVAVVDANTLYYTVTGLTAGVGYQFRVLPKNSVGTASSATVVSATAATKPGGASANAAKRDLSFDLTWSAPSDNGSDPITGYIVQSSTDGTNWTQVTSTDANTFAYTVTGLTAGVSYRFRVLPQNSIGTATTATVVSATAATKPAGASANAAKKDLSFDLTWSAPSDNGSDPITRYLVQVSTDGITWTQVASLSPTTFAYTVTGLTAGVGYQFRVLPQNSIGTAATATVVSATAATKPGAPSSHGHTAVDQAITIEWVAPSSDGSDSILGYEVEVCEVGASSCAATVDVAPTATSYQATGLDKTKRYNINVKAKNSIGKSINAASFTNILAATGSGSSAPTVTAPSGVSSPITRGNPVIGSTLSLTQGNWTTTSGTVTLTYQWYVCSAPITVPTSTDPGCTLIVGATSPSFTVTSAQSGSYVTVAVTGVSGISPNETSLTVWATSTLVRAYTPSPERVRDVVLPNPKVKLDPKVPAAVIPLPENTGLISGQKKVEEGGSQVLVAITPNDTSTAIKVEATDWTLKFVPKTSTGEAVPIENARQMTVNRGGQVQVIGTSYLPRTTVKVWMFSTPVLLGEFLTDDFGNFSENVAIPAQLPLGEHTIQVAGVSPEDNLRSVSLPVITKDLKFVSGRAKFAAGSSAVTKTSQSQIAKFVTNALKNPKSLTIKVTTFATSKVQTSSEKALLSARLTAVKALITKLGYSGRIQVVTGTSAANAANSNQILVAASWLVSK